MTGVSPTDPVGTPIPPLTQAATSEPAAIDAAKHKAAIDAIATQMSNTNLIDVALQAVLTPLKLSPQGSPIGVDRSVMMFATNADNRLRNSNAEYSRKVLHTKHLVRDANEPGKFSLKDPLNPSQDQSEPTGRYNFITLPARNKIKELPDRQTIDFLPTNYRILVSPHDVAGEAKAHCELSDRSMAVLHAGMVKLDKGKVKSWDNGSSTYAVPDSSVKLSGFPEHLYVNYQAAYQQIKEEQDASSERIPRV